MKIADYSFNDIVVGQKVAFTRTLTKEDVSNFVKLSGDENPLHMDESYAKTTRFGKPIVHGMMLGVLCSTLVGMYLPGKRALYLQQTLNFKKPVYPGESLVVKGTVIEKSTGTHLIKIAISIVRDTEEVLGGEASVQIL